MIGALASAASGGTTSLQNKSSAKSSVKNDQQFNLQGVGSITFGKKSTLDSMVPLIAIAVVGLLVFKK